MPTDPVRLATALTALLAAGAGAGAQDTGSATTLPLTSVGKPLMWSVGDQQLRLDVPVAGRVRLELYSPRLDPADYRGDTYYGDERYVPGESVTTTFTLLDEADQPVLTRTYTPGAQEWDTLLDRELPAGQYRLQASTQGHAKNTFAVRLGGVSAALSADTLTVNIHSREWVPALKLTLDGQPHVLRMYDGDGPEELDARLRADDGTVYPLPVSADLDEVDLPLPLRAGGYTLELRQPPAARQFSNTVGFRVTRAGQPTPITLGRVDRTGTLKVSAQLVLPGGAQPTGADVLIGAVPTRVDGQLTQTVPAGRYAVTPAAVPGAQVEAGPAVDVPEHGQAEATVRVRPQVQLSVAADKTVVCPGDTVTVTARADTAYAGELPLDLSVDAPGLTLHTPAAVQGTLTAGTPGELVVTGTATQAGPLTVRAVLAGWNQTRDVHVDVRPDATSVTLQRAPLGPATVGDVIPVRVTVTNTAGVPVPFLLHDQPGAGLEAMERAELDGTLLPGESRTLAYSARVTQPGELRAEASLVSEGCAATQTVQGTVLAHAAPQPAPAAPTPVVDAPAPAEAVTVPLPSPAAAPALPAVERVSTVTLPFDAPGQARELVVAQAIPDGAALVPGSSRVDGEVVADPLRGPSGVAYWTLPQRSAAKATVRGAVTYDLAHTVALADLPAPALLARYAGDRSEVLMGQLDQADLKAAAPQGSAESATENSGAIKQPLDGSLIRVRDRIAVVVEQAAGQSGALSVNGQVVGGDRIGEITEDGVRGVTRITYVGVPLRPGPNTLQLGTDTVTVHLAGPTAQLRVQPEQLVADGSTPLRVRFRALDAYGHTSAQTTVSLRSTLEITTPDAAPGESGFQLRLVNGEGVLELQPQSSPTTLTLDVLDGGAVQPYTFEVRPDGHRVGVGMLSATLGLDGHLSVADDLRVQARASLETPLGSGKLYVAADTGGLPTDRDPLQRNAVSGDRSTESAPLQGLDPVALTYDHPDFRVDYRQSSVPVDVLPVGEQLTALTASSKGAARVSGFVALVPEDRVTGQRIVPEGTRLLRLPTGGIEDGSETLTLLTREHGTGKELRRLTLRRNVDYLLDVRTGIITLARALDPVDADLNDVVVVADYRLQSALGHRTLAAGAQFRYTARTYSVGVAAVRLDDAVTVGARATYDDGTVRADGLLAYSGGLQASVDAGVKLGADTAVAAKLRYQDAGYAGLAPIAPGLTVGVDATRRISPTLTASAQAEYHDTGADAARVQGGSVTARADYQLAPFTVGAGLKSAFGDQHGLAAVVGVGYHRSPVDVDITHSQPLGGAGGTLDSTTTVTTRYALTDTLTLGLTDQLNWRTGNTAAVTLDSTLGATNYAATYDLPGSGGQGNRARFGVTTALPLGERLSAGLRGSATYDLNAARGELGAGADLHYTSDGVVATTGTDVTVGARGFGVVLRGGVSGRLTDQLTVTADGLVEFGAGKGGVRAAVGYAYRSAALNSLGTVRYVTGTLAGGAPEFSSTLAAEYRQANWAVRGGLDTRTLLDDPGSFTLQGSVGATVYVTDYFGLGAWGRAVTQPGSHTAQYGLGLEASVRALPGTWITAGYNPVGFDGVGTTYTKRGAYLRVDLTLDDSLLSGQNADAAQP
ncbi:hypothetical protein HNQ07_001576 [Deinococcus metalli]|uniref:DUF11 domain-containing protein n=1 Tax=Deinococcus metalli TaxID=1141878 RepID=A0A7W8KDE9_9DEIO|nr:DUF11 domain-containing protein [Deinococcus metalli]MBB5376119.1 hypothetical protein [Deinococcus metalli]GHF40659.1 hypothetical protein GCM10017781_16640 [Deinococcus metalli]